MAEFALAITFAQALPCKIVQVHTIDFCLLRLSRIGAFFLQFLVDLLAAADVIPASGITHPEAFSCYHAVMDGVAACGHNLQRAVKDEDEDVCVSGS